MLRNVTEVTQKVLLFAIIIIVGSLASLTSPPPPPRPQGVVYLFCIGDLQQEVFKDQGILLSYYSYWIYRGRMW